MPPLIYTPDDDEERPVTTDDETTVKTPISPKVTAATGSAALVGAVGLILRYAGLEIPEPVIAAGVVVATFAAGYFTPDRLREVGAVFARGHGEHRA